MLVAKDFRQKAREALSGNWAVAVGTGFVASLLGAYTAFTGGGGSGSSSSSDAVDNALESGSVPNSVILMITMIILVVSMVILAVALMHFIIGGAVTLGYVKFNLDMVDGQTPMFKDLFSQFHRFGDGFVMQLLRSLFIFLWTLLFIIPGMIATYRYAMTPYILYENPGMSASDAIKESKQLMDGNKWRLFCLNFSFIGWDLLGILSLGIGFLWIAPYREAAYAAFYREIKYNKYSQPYVGYSESNF